MGKETKAEALEKLKEKIARNKVQGEKTAAEWRAIVRGGQRGGLENGWDVAK